MYPSKDFLLNSRSDIRSVRDYSVISYKADDLTTNEAEKDANKKRK